MVIIAAWCSGLSKSDHRWQCSPVINVVPLNELEGGPRRDRSERAQLRG